MKITKFGHCCLLIEEQGVRIVTDPGFYSTQQNTVSGIDVVLITHEHKDHLHVDSLKVLLANNLDAKIFTNQSVGKILENGKSVTEKGVVIEAIGNDHEHMHASIPATQNTGYFIANRFLYPGDSFVQSGREVEIPALPVAGPWMKLSEAIDYALEVKPGICFPVHDGILKSSGSTQTIPPQVLGPRGVHFVTLDIDNVHEFGDRDLTE